MSSETSSDEVHREAPRSALSGALPPRTKPTKTSTTASTVVTDRVGSDDETEEELHGFGASTPESPFEVETWTGDEGTTTRHKKVELKNAGASNEGAAEQGTRAGPAGPRFRLPPSLQRTTTMSLGDSEAEHVRITWTTKCDFILSLVVLAVGLGNVWRFPYMIHKHGGGTFLIPYFAVNVFVALPMFFLELVLGQYVGQGAVRVFSRIAPIASGLGVAMLLNSFILSIYYNVILAWTLLYLFDGMREELPWSNCHHKYSGRLCHEDFPQEDYFRRKIEGRGDMEESDLNNYGRANWELIACLVGAWGIVVLNLMCGPVNSGKMLYFTAIFPYLVLVTLFVRGITLDGAEIGLRYMLTPNFTRLKEPEVWTGAASQVFFSSSSPLGINIIHSSFNRFEHNCHWDALAVTFINAGTSLFAGVIAYCVLGNLAWLDDITSREDFENILESGPGTSFILFPKALSRMPIIPWFWSALFFLMFLTLGLDSLFVMDSLFTRPIIERWPKVAKNRRLLTMLLGCITFLLGIPMCLSNGNLMLTLLDDAVTNWQLTLFGFLEVVLASWLYGANRVLDHTDEMGIKMNRGFRCFWGAMWYVVTPLSLAALLGLKLATLSPFGSDEDRPEGYPLFVQVFWWSAMIISAVVVPAGAIYKTYQTLKLKFKKFDPDFPSPKPVPKSRRSILALFKPTKKFSPSYRRRESNT